MAVSYVLEHLWDEFYCASWLSEALKKVIPITIHQVISFNKTLLSSAHVKHDKWMGEKPTKEDFALCIVDK